MTTKQMLLIGTIIVASLAAGVYIALAAPRGSLTRLRVDAIMMVLIGVAGAIKFAALTGIFVLRLKQEPTRRLRNLYFASCFSLLSLFLLGIAIAGIGQLL
jgi:hypothetical protein